MFEIQELSSARIESIQSTVEWDDACPVSLDRLVSVHFSHKDFDGNDQIGEMVVVDLMAENVKNIFSELYSKKFAIALARPVDEFGGDDVSSMNTNNSSAFNCRRIMNTDRWSSHAYGAAIDINPIQNPYVLIDQTNDTAKIYPKGGTDYLNRGIQEVGMVEDVVSIFKEYGFSDWRGAWKSPLDYHHFQVPWEIINSWDLRN